MSLLFETIRVHDGVLMNLSYHKLRIGESITELYRCAAAFDLEQAIQVPPEFREGTAKCRVVYGKQIESVTFSAYTPRRISSVQLVTDDTIEYGRKYTDRISLDALLLKRRHCDEILIVKNGRITDTSFSNIVFCQGKNWITPSLPLLRGTMRAYLLDQRIMSEKDIHVEDLKLFSRARLINAMLPFGAGNDISMENIHSL